jgi:phenylacetate-coenzyme A ligase PaaK-like adenylate-forming protein
VQWDHEKPKVRQREQEEQLREYVGYHLYPYSPFYRRRFDAAGIGPKNITAFGDLAKLEPTRWSDVTAEPVAFVLRPTERAIIRFGERKLVSAIGWAKARGKVSQVNRDVIDPAYKPVHWHFDGDVPVGYSAEDLERLAEAGRRILHLAGLTRDDAIVDVTPAGPSLEFWQLVDGARSAGLSAVHLGAGVAPERIEAAAPTVLAGPPDALQAALEGLGKGGHRIDGLRTLLVLGTLLDDTDRAALRALGQQVGEADVEVVLAWAPAGVRALWAECRGGRFFHTYPDMEWLEVLPDGEIAWTSLAWHGTVFFRLRTGVSGTIDDVACENCGRIGPRVTVTGASTASRPSPTWATTTRALEPAGGRTPATAMFGRPPAVGSVDDEDEDEVHVLVPLDTDALAVLDEHPGVAAWQAEYRRVDGVDELIVFVAPAGVDRLGPLFRELDLTLSATQYVVQRPEQIAERCRRDGAILDHR